MKTMLFCAFYKTCCTCLRKLSMSQKNWGFVQSQKLEFSKTKRHCLRTNAENANTCQKCTKNAYFLRLKETLKNLFSKTWLLVLDFGLRPRNVLEKSLKTLTSLRNMAKKRLCLRIWATSKCVLENTQKKVHVLRNSAYF